MFHDIGKIARMIAMSVIQYPLASTLVIPRAGALPVPFKALAWSFPWRCRDHDMPPGTGQQHQIYDETTAERMRAAGIYTDIRDYYEYFPVYQTRQGGRATKFQCGCDIVSRP
ncbi:MAG: hypothetical protein JJK57_09800 [Komagataeibacter hansenii]|nr:hypothetical protein [Novacetimonas hansenii]